MHEPRDFGPGQYVTIKPGNQTGARHLRWWEYSLNDFAARRRAIAVMSLDDLEFFRSELLGEPAAHGADGRTTLRRRSVPSVELLAVECCAVYLLGEGCSVAEAVRDIRWFHNMTREEPVSERHSVA